MSACISKHGEYSYHECSIDFVCDYCGVLDEDGLFAALNEARDKVARVEDILNEHGQWYSGPLLYRTLCEALGIEPK